MSIDDRIKGVTVDVGELAGDFQWRARPPDVELLASWRWRWGLGEKCP